jgi:hypothetical protein
MIPNQDNANCNDYFMNNDSIIPELYVECSICCIMHSTSRRPLIL